MYAPGILKLQVPRWQSCTLEMTLSSGTCLLTIEARSPAGPQVCFFRCSPSTHAPFGCGGALPVPVPVGPKGPKSGRWGSVCTKHGSPHRRPAAALAGAPSPQQPGGMGARRDRPCRRSSPGAGRVLAALRGRGGRDVRPGTGRRRETAASRSRRLRGRRVYTETDPDGGTVAAAAVPLADSRVTRAPRSQEQRQAP